MATFRSFRTKSNEKRWQARVRKNGITETATFGTKLEAQHWANQLEMEIQSGRYSRFVAGKIFQDAMDRYFEEEFPHKKSITPTLSIMNFWNDNLGSLLLTKVTQKHIEKCLKQKTSSPATYNRYLIYIRRFFNLCIQWEWLEVNPTRHIRKQKEPRGRERFLDDEELKRLNSALAKCSPELQAIVTIALVTGARKSEITSIRWTNVDYKKMEILLEDTKIGEPRILPMTPTIVEKLKQVQKSSFYCFPGKSGKPLDMRRQWDRLLEAAKIEDFRFHDLRHTAISYMIMGGVSPFKAAEIVGHKKLETTKRYTHLAREHVRGIVLELEKRLIG